MKSFSQEIRLVKRDSFGKTLHPQLFKHSKGNNNNRKEILRQMSTTTSISHKNNISQSSSSFKDKCLLNASSISQGLQSLKQFPKIKSSSCHPNLHRLLEACNMKPKAEKLLKGQNQLILERKKMKCVLMQENKKKIPLVHIMMREMKHSATKRNYSYNCIAEDGSNSLDSDRMDFNFDVETSNDLTSIESIGSISPSKKYDNIPMPLSKTTVFFQQDQQLQKQHQNKKLSSLNHLLILINKDKCSTMRGNIINRVKDIIQDYRNCQKSNDKKDNLNKSIKNNQSFSNFITSLSNTATTNTTQCLPFPLMKHFNSSSSQTNLFSNRNPKLKTINRSLSKSKGDNFTPTNSHKIKLKSKSQGLDLLVNNPYGLGIIFNSSNKFSYVIQLNKLDEWKRHEEAWRKLTENKDLDNNEEEYLLPPNIKDTIISSFYYQRKKRRSKDLKDNCFIYCLDHLHVKDFKHESTKWKEASQRIGDRWHADNLVFVFEGKTIKEELKLKMKEEAIVISDYAQGLCRNIISLLVEIFRYKLKKKLEC